MKYIFVLLIIFLASCSTNQPNPVNPITEIEQKELSPLEKRKLLLSTPYVLEILKKHYSILQNKLLEKIEHYLIFEGEDNYIDDILAELNDIVSINKHIERFQKMLLKMKTKELKLLMNYFIGAKLIYIIIEF